MSTDRDMTSHGEGRDLAILLYLEGEMSGPERDRFERALAEDPEFARELDAAREGARILEQALAPPLAAEPPDGYADQLIRELTAALAGSSGRCRGADQAERAPSFSLRHAICGAAAVLAAAAVVLVMIRIAEPTPLSVGEVVTAIGEPRASFRLGTAPGTRTLRPGDVLETLDTLEFRTGEGERLVIRLTTPSVTRRQTITIDERTRCVVCRTPDGSGTAWRLERGRLLADVHSRPLPGFRVETPEAEFVPLGTVFQVERRARSLRGSRELRDSGDSPGPAAAVRSLLTVVEGAVRVVTRPSERIPDARVEAGHEAAVDSAGRVDVARVAARAAVAWALAAEDAGAAGGRVLRHRFREGGSLEYRGYYRQRLKLQGRRAAPGLGPPAFEGGCRITTVSVAGDGRARVVLEHVEIGRAAGTTALSAQRGAGGSSDRGARLGTVALDVTSLGEMVFAEVTGLEGLLPDPRVLAAFGEAYGLLPRLPEAAVRPGDEWSCSGELPLFERRGHRVAVDLSVGYTYRGDEWSGDERLVVIEVVMGRRDLVVTDGAALRRKPLRVAAGTGSGTVRFSPARGIVVKADYRTTTSVLGGPLSTTTSRMHTGPDGAVPGRSRPAPPGPDSAPGLALVEEFGYELAGATPRRAAESAKDAKDVKDAR